jgi:hypothetical protein
MQFPLIIKWNLQQIVNRPIAEGLTQNIKTQNMAASVARRHILGFYMDHFFQSKVLLRT